MKAVEKGLKGDAAAHTRALLAEKQPLEVVDEALIPALDIVGAKYEKGTLFLPQLRQAASAAASAFEEIKTAIAQKGEGSASVSSLPPSRAMYTTLAKTSSGSFWKTTALKC